MKANNVFINCVQSRNSSMQVAFQNRGRGQRGVYCFITTVQPGSSPVWDTDISSSFSSLSYVVHCKHRPCSVQSALQLAWIKIQKMWVKAWLRL